MIVAVILAVVGGGRHRVHVGVTVEDNGIENGVARALARGGLVVDAHRVGAHTQVLDGDHVGGLSGGHQTGGCAAAIQRVRDGIRSTTTLHTQLYVAVSHSIACTLTYSSIFHQLSLQLGGFHDGHRVGHVLALVV